MPYGLSRQADSSVDQKAQQPCIEAHDQTMQTALGSPTSVSSVSVVHFTRFCTTVIIIQVDAHYLILVSCNPPQMSQLYGPRQELSATSKLSNLEQSPNESLQAFL